jgi:hypothetical protein
MRGSWGFFDMREKTSSYYKAVGTVIPLQVEFFLVENMILRFITKFSNLLPHELHLSENHTIKVSHSWHLGVHGTMEPLHHGRLP